MVSFLSVQYKNEVHKIFFVYNQDLPIVSNVTMCASIDNVKKTAVKEGNFMPFSSRELNDSNIHFNMCYYDYINCITRLLKSC